MNLLKMAFFRNLHPHREDPRSPLARRFPSGRVAVMNLGNMGAKVASVRFNRGVPQVENVAMIPTDPAETCPAPLLQALSDRSDTKAVVLGCSLKSIFSLSKFEPHDLECLAGFNGDMRDIHNYGQLLPHPDSEKTLRGMVDRSIITHVRDRVREAGLELVRSQIPSISILNRMLADPVVIAPPDGMVNIPVVCDQGMMHAVAVARGKWVAQRCTSVISRTANGRRDEEDEQMQDVINSCRRSIDTSFSARDSGSRPSHFNFLVVDTGTPALMDRLAHICMRLSSAHSVKITVEAYTPDANADLLCLVHDTKESA